MWRTMRFGLFAALAVVAAGGASREPLALVIDRVEEDRKNRERMVNHITEVPTVPRLLAERGYVSLQTGKWWQGHYRTGGFTQDCSPLQQLGVRDGRDLERRVLLRQVQGKAPGRR